MISRLILIALVLAATGCRSVAPPRILRPGPIQFQQDQAQIFDPYPQPDIAPYEVDMRPLQYATPAPENARSQNALSFGRRFRQAPPPGRFGPIRGAEYVPVPTVVPNPVSIAPATPGSLYVPPGGSAVP
jgi:hypothetical protein